MDEYLHIFTIQISISVDEVPIIDPWLLQCSWHSTRRCDPTWRSCLVFGWCQRPQKEGRQKFISSGWYLFQISLRLLRWLVMTFLSEVNRWDAIALNAKLEQYDFFPNTLQSIESILWCFFYRFLCWGNDGRLLPCLGLWLLRQASLHSAASHLVESTWDRFVMQPPEKVGLKQGRAEEISIHNESSPSGMIKIFILDLIVWELATSCRILQFSSESINHGLWKPMNNDDPPEKWLKIQETLTYRTLMEAEQSAQNSVSTNGRWRGTARLPEIRCCFGFASLVVWKPRNLSMFMWACNDSNRLCGW